jgi:hypothetical protein
MNRLSRPEVEKTSMNTETDQQKFLKLMMEGVGGGDREDE